MKRYLLDALIGFLLIIGGMSLAGFLADLVMPGVEVIYLFSLGLCLLPFLFFAHQRKVIVLSRQFLLYIALVIIFYWIWASVAVRLIPADVRRELYISQDNPWFFIVFLFVIYWLAKRVSGYVFKRPKKPGHL